MKEVSEAEKSRAEESVKTIMTLAFDAAREPEDLDAIGEEVLRTIRAIAPDERMTVLVCMAAMFMAIAVLLKDVLSDGIVAKIAEELHDQIRQDLQQNPNNN